MKRMLQFGSGPHTGPELADLGDLGDLGEYGEEADWENLNFDWISNNKNEDSFLQTTTQEPELQTQVFSRTATLFIRLKRNESSPAAVTDLGGLWRLSSQEFPVVVGSVSGALVLLLIIIMLSIYTCVQKKQVHKKYSVKSARSSCSSAKSGPIYSRDSFVVVTTSSVVPQVARLIAELDSPNHSYLDYEYYSISKSNSCICHDEKPKNQDKEDNISNPQTETSSTSIKHSHSLMLDQPLKKTEELENIEGCHTFPRSSLVSPIVAKPSDLPFQCKKNKEQITGEIAGSAIMKNTENNHTTPNNNMEKHGETRTNGEKHRETLRRNIEKTGETWNNMEKNSETLRSMDTNKETYRHMEKNGETWRNLEKNHTNNNTITTVEPETDQEANKLTSPTATSSFDNFLNETLSRSNSTTDQFRMSSSALASSVETNSCNQIIDDNFRTRSLPAWVRSKNRPIATLDDLNTIYEKEPTWSKRRRNRMRSDAAQIIALSKSRGRLLSPGSPVNNSSNITEPQSVLTDTEIDRPSVSSDRTALITNQAVIVYNERTAL